MKIKKNTKNYIEWEEQGKLDMDCRAWKDNKICGSIMANGGGLKIMNEKLKIRRLTPRECGRLMGVKDEDITKLLKNQTDNSAFHLFGDSIVINILMAIFKEMIE